MTARNGLGNDTVKDRSLSRFGSPAHTQCEATSKRSRKQCQGPAVDGTDPPRCRMHGGTTMAADASRVTTGAHSKYLPANIGKLYEEALNRPDVLELAEHIALLDAHTNWLLETLRDSGMVPRWSEVGEMFAGIETDMLSGKQDQMMAGLERMHTYLENGNKWDRTWDEVRENLEQMRKLADTEIKRKKELNQMVPLDRVVILMAAVATAVKRHVKDPIAIQAVYDELHRLHYGNKTMDGSTIRSGAIIDVSPIPATNTGG